MRSFYAHRFQKHKKTVKSSKIFALTGSAHVKAALKHVDETDPGLLLAMKLISPKERKMLRILSTKRTTHLAAKACPGKLNRENINSGIKLLFNKSMLFGVVDH